MRPLEREHLIVSASARRRFHFCGASLSVSSLVRQFLSEPEDADAKLPLRLVPSCFTPLPPVTLVSLERPPGQLNSLVSEDELLRRRACDNDAVEAVPWFEEGREIANDGKYEQSWRTYYLRIYVKHEGSFNFLTFFAF